MKKVFVAMSGDVFHMGHLNILKIARELGRLTVGLATDELNAQFKQMALFTYEQRKAIIENIKGVHEVIPQSTLDLEPNLRLLKPDFVVHGDDWKTGRLKAVRQRVIEVLQEWDGQLIEPPYTADISSTHLRQQIKRKTPMPHERALILRQILSLLPTTRLLSVHSGLTAAIAEKVEIVVDGRPRAFDAVWLSLKAEALARGFAREEDLELSARAQTVEEILSVTTKPLVLDIGCPHSPSHAAALVKRAERMGVSAVALSDSANQRNGEPPLEDSSNFAQQLTAAKAARKSSLIQLVACTNLLSARLAVPEAIRRVSSYVKAGADVLVLETPTAIDDEVKLFCHAYRKSELKVPLLFLLSADSVIQEPECVNLGAKGFIFDTHLLSGAYGEMVKTAESLLQSTVAGLTLTPLSEIAMLLGRETE